MAKESFGAHNIGFDDLRDARIEKKAKEKEHLENYKEKVRSFRDDIKVDLSKNESNENETEEEKKKKKIIQDRAIREVLQDTIEEKILEGKSNETIKKELMDNAYFVDFEVFFDSYINNKRSKLGENER